MDMDLRKLVRSILREAVAIGADGRISSDEDSVDVTMELVGDYIKKNKISVHSRYGGADDYILPLEAQEYFDHLGFKRYKVVKVRKKTPGSVWQKHVQVEFWHGDPMHEAMEVYADGTVDKSWEHDSLEINHDLVTDYIRANRIGERKGIGFYADYELPLEAKEYFDAIGFQDYTVERATNQRHPDFGKDYILVSSFFNVDRK